MKFMVTDRGEGKTAALLDWMERAPAGEVSVCVTPNADSKFLLQRRARSESRLVEAWQFISAEEFRDGSQPLALSGRRGRVVLAIDDAEQVLASLFPWPLDLVTATGQLLEPAQKEAIA